LVIPKLFKKKELKKIPKHVAILVNGVLEWKNIHKKNIKEVMFISFKNLYNIFLEQTKLNIPIITIYFKTNSLKKSEYSEEIINNLTDFLNNLKKDQNVHKNKIKISVLGKWYDLHNSLVHEIRDVIDETKEYDNFFINLCLNYDGQEEIVDACKIIAKKIEAGIIKSSSINKEIIKDNLYSSYFVPPDLIIISGKKSSTDGILLWDSQFSTIYFSEELWPDFELENFYKALEYYEKMR
jgi:undecaprenyl diphosphate synthase